MKIEGLPVVDVDESEKVTVAVRADGLLEGDTADPERHPIAIALRRQDDVDDARVTKNATLIRRGKQWFRYDAGQAVVQAIAKDSDASEMTDERGHLLYLIIIMGLVWTLFLVTSASCRLSFKSSDNIGAQIERLTSTPRISARDRSPVVRQMRTLGPLPKVDFD